MIFIGVALLIAAGLALVIASDAGSLVGMSQDQTAQLIPLLLILVIIAGGMFGRRRRFGELLSNLGLWVGIFAVVVVGYSYRNELTTLVGRVTGELAPGTAIVSPEGGSASFRRSFGGSFRINADVNGSSIPMIFDTGATAVVLTTEDAEAAGFDTGRLRYAVRVQTANGVGRAAGVTLDRIIVGDIERRNIRAFVAEDGALEMSLLGMTFLETLSGYSVNQDSLEFRD